MVDPGRVGTMRQYATGPLFLCLVIACGSDSSDRSPTQSGDDPPVTPTLQEYAVPAGSRPHDVAPAIDGGVWYTAQRQGALGHLDPATGATRHIRLGTGSAPHGVIVGPDGAPWITDGGLNAIVRVDPATEEVQVYPLPQGSANANLNTATFDLAGVIWFTGQNGNLRAARSGTRRCRSVLRTQGPRPVRDRHYTRRLYLLRLAGGQLCRPHRPRVGRGHRARAPDFRTRSQESLVGQPGKGLGK